MRKFWSGVVVLLVCLLFVALQGCTTHDPNIGNQTAEMKPAYDKDGNPIGGKITQVIVLVAPDASLSTRSNQDPENTGNLGLNGGAAASDQAKARGVLETLYEYVGGALDDKIVYPQVVPEDPPADTSIKEPKEITNNYHHFNPQSWDGRGSSIVLCPGVVRMKACDIDGHVLKEHPNQDNGRWVWTDYGVTGLSGIVTCRGSDGEDYRYEVPKTGDMYYGDCS